MERPLISYASPIWVTAGKTNIKEIEVLQNKTVLQIRSVPSFVRRKDFHKDLHLTSIKKYFKNSQRNSLKTKHFMKLQNTIPVTPRTSENKEK